MDTYKSLSSITYMLNLFALNCIWCRNGKLYATWPKKKVAVYFIVLLFILTALIYFCYYAYFVEMYPFTEINAVEILQVFVGYLQFHIDLYFVYKHGRSTKLKYFNLFENIDRILGVNNNLHEIVKNRIVVWCTIFGITWFVSSTIDFGALYVAINLEAALAYIPDYFFALIKMVTILDFISQVILIEYRLKAIVDILDNHFTECVSKYNYNNWVKATDCVTTNFRLENLKSLHNGFNDVVPWLVNCYLYLIKQSNHVNKMFGFRILMNCASIILDMVFFLSVVYKSIVGTLIVPYETGTFDICSTFLKFLNGPLVLVSFVYCCEQCYRQNESIINTVEDLLIIKETDLKSKKPLIDLHKLAQSRPITFKAANFFSIKYTVLVSTASVCITYCIILA